MNGRKLMISCLLWVVCFPVFAQRVTYVHTDALGSPVVLTDANRNVVERREYEPYGRQLTPAPQDGPGYTGHVYDAATGMVYMQQRYYDPWVGRFLSVDPVTFYGVGDMRLFSRYAYAVNNPNKFIDLDGRAPKSICERNIRRCSSIIQVGPATMRDGDGVPRSGARRTKGLAKTTPSGAPTEKLDNWMRSSDPNDKIKAAIAAAKLFKIDDSDYSYRYSTFKTTASAYVMSNNMITLYSPAFRSWSWLGSTLGHEIEGHAGATDFSDRGLWKSEQKAWSYSLKSVSRFGNSPAEIVEIENAERYYNSQNYDE